MSELPPIRREVVVAVGAADAFDLFTARIGLWWPVAELSVLGAGAEVAFVDGEIIERLGEKRVVWGTVSEWQPGARLSFTWHPGAPAREASLVSVDFAAGDDGATRVTLQHSGWERFADPPAARSEYEHGWPIVLSRYADAAAHHADPQAGTWVALLHRPGPAAPVQGTVFDDPRFGLHVEFLQRMQGYGYLVAAGPLADEPGAGMTILRLPGEDGTAEAVRLATEEDRSVSEGFFDVSVRPWKVMLSR